MFKSGDLASAFCPVRKPVTGPVSCFLESGLESVPKWIFFLQNVKNCQFVDIKFVDVDCTT
jgi:hypothetical protein